MNTLSSENLQRLACYLDNGQLEALVRSFDAVMNQGSGFGRVEITITNGKAKEFGTQFTLRPEKPSAADSSG